MSNAPAYLPAGLSQSKRTDALERYARYVIAFGNNHLRAFQHAFPARKGTNEGLRVIASKLVQSLPVQGILKRMRASEAEHLAAVQERLREELPALAYSRITDVMEQDEDGFFSVRQLSDVPDGAIAAIQEITVTEEETTKGVKSRRTKLKLVPKNEAQRNLMEHYGLRKEPDPPSIEFDFQIVNVATSRTETDTAYATAVQEHQIRDTRAAQREEAGE